MTQPIIYPLFSTPVYVNNVGDFARPDIKALEYSTSEYSFQSSVDKNVLHRPDFMHVHDIVLSEVNAYARGVLAEFVT